MAKTVEVDLQVNSNIQGSIAELKALKRQLKDTAAGSAEFKALYNQIDDLEDKIKSSKNASSDWIDSLEQAGGPIGALGASLNRAKVATQSFGGALKATGIGLIVTLVAGLAAAFSENETAMKKLQPLLNGMQKIFQGIFRIVEPLFNAIIDFAVASIPSIMKGIGGFYSALVGLFSFVKEAGSGYLKIWKGILTLDFDVAKEGIEQLKNSFATAVKAGQDSYKRFTAGTKEMTKSQKEEQSKQAEANKKHQDEINAKNKAAQEGRLKKQKEYLEAKQKADDEARAKEKKDLEDYNNFLISIDNANRERRVAEALEKEESDAKVLSDATAMVDALNAEDERKLENEKKITDERIKIAQAEADAKRAIQLATLDTASNGIALISKLFEKNKGIQKAALLAESAIGIAKIIINTQTANALARTKYALLPGGVALAAAEITLNKINAGIGIASNLAGTAKGLQALGGGAASGASVGGGGAAGGSAPLAAAPQFNVVGTSGQNQIAQSLGNQAPVKAYVVSNDVTSAQSLDRNIVKTATLGN